MGVHRSTDQLIHEIQLLPVEERAKVVDLVLKSLNHTVAEVDRYWADLSLRRLEEINSGKVMPISGEKVFEEIWDRFR